MLNSWPLAKDLQVLVEIVHSGSFSAAAATLGQTPAFVTKRIQILENTLATMLLNRSARGVALSQVGNVGPELGQGYIIDSFLVVDAGGGGRAGDCWHVLAGTKTLWNECERR